MLRRRGWSDFVETLDLRSELTMTNMLVTCYLLRNMRTLLIHLQLLCRRQKLLRRLVIAGPASSYGRHEINIV